MVLLIEMVALILLGAVLFIIYAREIALAKKNGHKASLEEFWPGKNRRRHVRFKNKLEFSYTVSKKVKLKNKGTTVDISEGGIKILIDEKLGIGSILEFMIVFPDNGRSAKVEGEVVWSEESDSADPSGKRFFYSGIKLLAIKEPSGSNLIEYIRSLPSSLEA